MAKKMNLSTLNEDTREEVKSFMKNGKVKVSDLPLELKEKVLKENMPSSTRSLWGVLGIKNITELPNSPMMPIILQICKDNRISGHLKYGRFSGNGTIYIIGDEGYVGIGLLDGQLAGVETGMLHTL